MPPPRSAEELHDLVETIGSSPSGERAWVRIGSALLQDLDDVADELEVDRGEVIRMFCRLGLETLEEEDVEITEVPDAQDDADSGDGDDSDRQEAE